MKPIGIYDGLVLNCNVQELQPPSALLAWPSRPAFPSGLWRELLGLFCACGVFRGDEQNRARSGHASHSFAKLGLILLFGFTVLMSVHAAGRQLLARDLPVAAVHLPPLGRLPASKHLQLAIGLPLRNPEALTNLLFQIYDPHSPSYRHYVTPAQFTEMFGPTEQNYRAVVDFAKVNGLTVIHEHPNRLLLDVSGSVAEIEKMFQVQMRVYSHPTEARNFYAPDIEPSWNLAVPILRIIGLNDYALPQPMNLVTGQGAGTEVIPQVGSGPGGTYRGYDFRSAYAPGVSLDGAGQIVGLLEFDGYYPNDILAYETNCGLPQVTLSNVLLNGFTGTPVSANLEVALDIEMAIAMAPGLAQVIIYETGPQGSGDTILNRMATDNLAKQLSSSWTWGTGNDPIANQIFLEFAAQGQTFFNASGDVNAYPGAIPFPADSPFITVVGGTTLVTGTGAAWTSETVWNFNNGKGSSGGISTGNLLPDWQQGIDMTINQGSTTHRNIPDVALTANGIWVTYNNGQSTTVAGTSCAAPLWAGFMALVNQQGAAYGQPPVGFLNPALYAIGQSPNYATCFHDIVTGNNTNSSTPTRYFAVPGYDLCTGWGTPNGEALIAVLEPPSYLAVAPGAGFTASSLPGGPFTVTAQTLYLSNAGPTMLTWSLTNVAPWLDASPTDGTLMPAGPATSVVVSLNSDAYALPAGTHNAALEFIDQTTGLRRKRQFTVQVSQSLVQNGGFETADFTDWNLVGSSSANHVSSGHPIAPRTGVYAAAFGQFGSVGYLSQALLTVPGQSYLLSFWLENPTTGIPNEFLVNWNPSLFTTNTIYHQTNLGLLSWTNLQFIVSAAGTNSFLQFGFRNDLHYLGLDDVSLQPIPLLRPAITADGGDSLTLSWATLPDLNYQLQYTTNLTQGNWQNLGASVAATNVTMSLSDPLGVDFQRFYRVIGSP